MIGSLVLNCLNLPEMLDSQLIPLHPIKSQLQSIDLIALSFLKWA
jgi:hypothetical protein